MKKKNNKSFNIKLPKTLSSGELRGSFMSNEFSLFNSWFSSAVSYEAAGKGSKMKKKNNKSFNIKLIREPVRELVREPVAGISVLRSIPLSVNHLC